MVGEDNSTLIPKLIICLIAAASAAVVVTIYHCITAGHIRALFCGRRSTNSNSLRSFTSRLDETQQSSVENSLANLIPSHKYKKGSGLSVKQDGMCPICISDFEDGEEIRTLPECLHSYHVPCIDMWLYSHSNCPMCRTNAAPTSLMLMHLVEDGNPETTQPSPQPVMQQQPSHLSV